MSQDGSSKGSTTGGVIKNPEEIKKEEGGYKQVSDQIMKKYNLKNIIEIQKKFIELKQERRDLRTKLDNFQKTFE